MKKQNDFIKAIKRADREISLGNGWVAKDRPHKNKKKYDRNKYKNIEQL